MRVEDEAEAFLKDAVREATEGDEFEIHSSSPSGGWRAMALLTLAASAIGAQPALAGAAREGRIIVRDVTGVVRDINQVISAGDRVEAARDRHSVTGVLSGVSRILSTAEKYEKAAPSKPATSRAGEPRYKSPEQFFEDFGLDE